MLKLVKVVRLVRVLRNRAFQELEYSGVISPSAIKLFKLLGAPRRAAAAAHDRYFLLRRGRDDAPSILMARILAIERTRRRVVVASSLLSRPPRREIVPSLSIVTRAADRASSLLSVAVCRDARAARTAAFVLTIHFLCCIYWHLALLVPLERWGVSSFPPEEPRLHDAPLHVQYAFAFLFALSGTLGGFPVDGAYEQARAAGRRTGCVGGLKWIDACVLVGIDRAVTMRPPRRREGRRCVHGGRPVVSKIIKQSCARADIWCSRRSASSSRSRASSSTRSSSAPPPGCSPRYSS